MPRLEYGQSGNIKEENNNEEYKGRKVLLTSSDGRYVSLYAIKEDVKQMEEIQRLCFPHLSEAEIATEAHFLSHQEYYPKGQFVVIDTKTDRVVATGSTFKKNINLSHYAHSYLEESGDNFFTTHDNNGEWLYLADIGVHPEARGKKLTNLLYPMTEVIMQEENLKGRAGGAMPIGYAQAKEKEGISIETYVNEVVSGKRNDPTLSVHLAKGLYVWGIIPEYIEDSSCDNYGVLVISRNKHYKD